VPGGPLVHLPVLLHPRPRRGRLDPAAVHRRRVGLRLLNRGSQCLTNEAKMPSSLKMATGLSPPGFDRTFCSPTGRKLSAPRPRPRPRSRGQIFLAPVPVRGFRTRRVSHLDKSPPNISPIT
jgi:hypothetical protein